MRTLIAVSIACSSIITCAQAQSKSVNLEALRTLIGGEPENVGVTFVGDDVQPYLDGREKTFSAWGKFKRKTDVFVVFSEETKAVLEPKTRKKVVIGDSIGAYFTRSWRAQGFLTWVYIQGDKVAFVKTYGRPADQKVKRVQGESDTRLAEFASAFSEKKKKVEVLLVGTMVDQAYLDTTDLEDELKKLERKLSYIIVPTEEMKQAFSKVTTKEIYIKKASPDPGEEDSMVDKIRWMIVTAKGSELVRVLGSGRLSSILTPR